MSKKTPTLASLNANAFKTSTFDWFYVKYLPLWNLSYEQLIIKFSVVKVDYYVLWTGLYEQNLNCIWNRTFLIRTSNSEIPIVKDSRDAFGCAYSLNCNVLRFFVLFWVLLCHLLLKFCMGTFLFSTSKLLLIGMFQLNNEYIWMNHIIYKYSLNC
jgi:hypothetical protein